jgi:hypothetical protein
MDIYSHHSILPHISIYVIYSTFLILFPLPLSLSMHKLELIEDEEYM